MRVIRLGKPAQRGFTVVELMVAMGISLLLMAGVLTLFANSRENYESNDRLGRIQENGRFALEQIARDVRSSGYLGCAQRTADSPYESTLANPAALLWNFALPVNGFNAAASTWAPILVAPLDAAGLPDRDGAGPDASGPAAGSDILVLRGPRRDTPAQRVVVTATSLADPISVQRVNPPRIAVDDVLIGASCEDAFAFRVTGYAPGAGASDPDVITHTGLSEGLRAFESEVYPVATTIYFIDTSTDTNSGSANSLWRMTSRMTAGVSNPILEEVVEGVDNLQVQYGVDTDNDRFADSYVSADAVTNWDRIISVRIALLVRSLEEYGRVRDNATRTILDANIAAFSDRRQRQVFTTTATVRNETE